MKRMFTLVLLYIFNRPIYSFEKIEQLPPEIQCKVYNRVINDHASKLPPDYYVELEDTPECGINFLWLDIREPLDYRQYKYDAGGLRLIDTLFAYKIFLKKYHPKIIQVTFAGLAKFITWHKEPKPDAEAITQRRKVLKEIYCRLDKPTRIALRAIFDTHYQGMLNVKKVDTALSPRRVRYVVGTLSQQEALRSINESLR
jgi:hypothetical protein